MAVQKTHFSNKELAEIFSKYNLGTIVTSKLFSTGAVQTNIFIKTNKSKFVFRYYEQGRPIKSIQFEINLLKYLKNKGYPCPGPYKDNNGKYVKIYKGKPFVVFEFIEGEHIKNPTSKQKQQLIQKVAELQIFTKNYKPFHKKSRYNYGIDFCKKIVKEKAKKINTPNTQQKLKWYMKELANLKLPKTLSKGICHCDFHFSNVLFKGDKFNALIDFDDANYTFLTFDLICLFDLFIPSFDWNTWKKFKKENNVFDFTKARNQVIEYEKYRPLNNNEKKYLFDVFKLSVLIDCIWYFERGDVKDFFEKRKIDYLNKLGRERFYNKIFRNNKI